MGQWQINKFVGRYGQKRSGGDGGKMRHQIRKEAKNCRQFIHGSLFDQKNRYSMLKIHKSKGSRNILIAPWDYVNKFYNMHNLASSKTEFCAKQLSILNEIIDKLPKSKKFQYKEITLHFNQICAEAIPKFKPKSIKAINIKIKEICQIEKHYWSLQLEQIMLKQVANGRRWKEIVNIHDFQKNGISPEQVKRKFQCGIRNKFLCLYREVYGNKKPPKISDVVFKCLLQENKIMEFFQDGSLDEKEKNCLEKNKVLFITCIDVEQQKTTIRSSKVKSKVLSLVDSSTSAKLLVDTILKLNSQKQCKKLDVVEQLLNETQPHKPSRSVRSTPDFSKPHDRIHELCNADDDRKIDEIEHQITFDDFDNAFMVGAGRYNGDFSFDQFDLSVEF